MKNINVISYNLFSKSFGATRCKEFRATPEFLAAHSLPLEWADELICKVITYT